MAELLGVVAAGAGLASLAIQLGQSSAKIKHIYESYQEAPKMLADLGRELEDFALTLHSLEKDRQQCVLAAHDVVGRCIQTSARAVAQIESAINKFELGIRQSKFRGRLRAALVGRSNLIQLCDDLERAKTSLIFACQLYMMSRQKRDTARILEQIDNKTVVLQQVIDEVVELRATDEDRAAVCVAQHCDPPDQISGRPAFQIVPQPQPESGQTNRRRDNQRSWRICMTPWFTNKIWQISFSNAQSGFSLNVRMCNIIPADSLIFNVCAGGDVSEVEALFRSGAASPYDCSDEGMTVLAAAARPGNLRLCRYLVEIAGYPLTPSNASDPLDCYAWNRSASEDPECRNGLQTEALEMYRLLLNQPEWDVDKLVNERGGGPWWWSCPDTACLKLVEDELAMAFSNLSAQERAGLALHNYGYWTRDLPHMVLRKLGFSAVDTYVAQVHDKWGYTVLHTLAAQQARNSGSDERDTWDVPSSWVDFVKQVVKCGADVHHQTHDGDTPFMLLLYHIIPSYGASLLQQAATALVRGWISMLEQAGVDLVTYGRRESTLWHAVYPSGMRCGYNEIASWMFGPRVDDWTVESFELCEIPIFQRIDPPGCWSRHHEFDISSICWEPTSEDCLGGPCKWSKVRQITLRYKTNPFTKELAYLDKDYRYLDPFRDFNDTQDDCRIIVNLISRQSRHRLRPRSSSQPRRRGVFAYNPRHHWLPMVHVCLEDRQVKFGIAQECNYRACAREDGVPMNYLPDHDRTSIDNHMVRFRTRYRTLDELRSLPYAAYHQSWKRD